MTRSQISRAATADLERRLNDLVQAIGSEWEDKVEGEYEAIIRELEGREHDLRDPSSGLGIHQPT